MDEIEFSWEPEQLDAMWNAKYTELVQFHQTRGHSQTSPSQTDLSTIGQKYNGGNIMEVFFLHNKSNCWKILTFLGRGTSKYGGTPNTMSLYSFMRFMDTLIHLIPKTKLSTIGQTHNVRKVRVLNARAELLNCFQVTIFVGYGLPYRTSLLYCK